jgi:DNA-directed RNA polymerase specialized sigma24 family protein
VKELWDGRYLPADHEIVKRKASKFARSNHVDADDIAQDLAAHIFQQSPRYDPNRGSREQFVTKVTTNKLLNIVEARNAKKRDDRRNLEYDDAPDRALIDGTMNESQVDLQVEMRAMAESLAPELRQIYDLMLQGYREADIQKHLHLGRQRVRTLMQKVTDAIRNANLNRYIGGQPEDD